jgi:transcriptional regulator with XRE-family HTH domain
MKEQVKILKKLTKQELDNKLGEKLKILRLTYGLKQSEIANMMGVTRWRVSNYESGTNPIPVARLLLLCNLLSLDITFFIEDFLKPSNPTETEQMLEDMFEIFNSLNIFQKKTLLTMLKTMFLTTSDISKNQDKQNSK